MIDFGTATTVESDELLTMTIGTPHFIAPEVLEELYGLKCDVWSCGVLAYLMLASRLPFEGQSV